METKLVFKYVIISREKHTHKCRNKRNLVFDILLTHYKKNLKLFKKL